MGFIIIKTHHHLGEFVFELFKHRTSKPKSKLGGGFKHCLFSSLLGKDEPLLTIYIYFSNGLKRSTHQLGHV